MAKLPKGFVPDDPKALPSGFVPDVPDEVTEDDTPMARGVVDAVEDGTARVVTDDGRVVELPSHLVPGKESDETSVPAFLVPGTKRQKSPSRTYPSTGPIEQIRKDLDPAQLPDVNPLTSAARGFGGALNSLADRFTFGAYGAANRALGSLGVPGASDAADSIDSYRSEHPFASVVSDAPAYLAAGPARALATGVERLIPQASSAIGRTGRAALSSGVTSGVIGGAEAGARGEEPGEILREAGQSALIGGAIGGGAAAGLGVLGNAARRVMGSRGAQAREFVESRGGVPGRKHTDADIGEAAKHADERVKLGLEEYRRDVAERPYNEAISQISDADAKALVDVRPIYSDLAKSYYDPANLQVRGQIKELMDLMEFYQRGNGSMLMTEEGLNGLRRGIAGVSKVGVSTEGKLSPLRSAFGKAKSMVDMGPYAEANRLFSEGTAEADESLKMLDLRRSRSAQEPIKGNLGVKAQRLGQNTVTAGRDRPGVDAFREKHPDLAAELDAPELMRSESDLAFHLLPHAHGGLIERTAGAAGLAPALMLAGAGHGGQGVASLLAGLALQNATPIAGRVLYNPARALLRLEPLVLGETPAISQSGARYLLGHSEGP